ncbi:MAG: DUF2284 domain-containing protein [Candidatus Adiutrix sp.]|jgi:predicted metal-binding protein|nr:DUF2284 domain-containing protein [Candidatus Adiutrix sp.]
MKSASEELLIKTALSLGAHMAALVRVADVRFDPAFRAACEANRCGNYGKSWTCPPDVGDIHALVAKASSFDSALVFQSVTTMKSSFDYRAVMDLGQKHNELTARLALELAPLAPLALGAGKCSFCKRCAKLDEEKCRFPDKAVRSMEAHGIDVYALSKQAGLKYNNGEKTMTLFGCLLLPRVDGAVNSVPSRSSRL